MSRAESETSGLSLLGCTDWRAGLGIHRTQAGRIGSSTERGQRVEARCTTTTPAIYSVTSATDPAAPRPGGATRVLGQGPARVRNHRHRPRPPERARARCPTVTVPGPPERARARCPAEDDSASSGEPASVTAPGRRSAPGPVPGRTAVRPGGPVATDCAARGGSTGLHSGLRTGRIAGLLCRPWAGRHEHGCHVVGAVPGRQRREEIAAVGRARCGPADPPMSGVRAGARTAMQVKFATRAAGRGSRAGRRTGPARVSGESAYPRARAACRVSRAAGGVLTLGPGAAILASQAAGGALTGPWPAPAAGLGRAGRARATRTTPPPELRDGRRGRPGPETRTTLPPEPRAGREDGRA